MTQSVIENRMKFLIIKQLGVKEDDISVEKAFVDDLGADSLDVVELLMAMEEEFGFEISEEEADGLRTVGDAVAYISRQQSV